MNLLPLCLFLILVVPSIAQESATIALLTTGNGIIQAQQSTDISGTLVEVPYSGIIGINQIWGLVTYSGFNGVFIASYYSSLVWDSQGDLAVAGNPIILYKQKETVDQTKNQRWVWTSLNHFCLIKDETFVARHASGHLSLAKSNKTDVSQNIYIITPANVTTVEVLNNLPNTPTITAMFTSSVVGKFGGELNAVNSSLVLVVPTGSWLMINDSNGVLLYNHTIPTTASGGFYIAVPLVQFPVGQQQYTGYSTDGSDDASLTLTFSGVGDTTEGVVTGSGTDNFGAFTITNGYYNLAWNVNFDRVYDGFTHLCYGNIDATGTIISGTWQSEDGALHDFQYTLSA